MTRLMLRAALILVLLFANDHQAGRTLSMHDVDADGKPGFSFDERDWPHGWRGSANPHGVVFSR